VIRAWLKGPKKPAAPNPDFNADMSDQELLDELLKVTGKTVSDEFSISVKMPTTVEAASEVAARLYPKLREHWKAVTCFAQPRKKGAAIQIKVLAPKPTAATGTEETPKPLTLVPQAASIAPSEGMSSQQLVELVLEATGKSIGDQFSAPIHVDMELEQAQALATSLYKGLCKHWKLVSCVARARKTGCTIQVRVMTCSIETQQSA
jgi:hypothetical protein